MTKPLLDRPLVGSGDFWFDQNQYRLYLWQGTDSGRLSRVFPDPVHGRKVAWVWGLESPLPRFLFPVNWPQPRRRHAKREIQQLWLDEQERRRPFELNMWGQP
jgi:hypothetical protein